MLKQLVIFLFLPAVTFSQTKPEWKNVDSLYGPLPKGVHVFFTNTVVDTPAFRAFYLIADLKNKKLEFTTDTTSKRRLTPSEFYNRNGQPLVVVNGTFFSFATNENLNLVIHDGKLVSVNQPIAGKGKDTFTYRHTYASAIGISKRRNADVAWTYTTPDRSYPLEFQVARESFRDSFPLHGYDYMVKKYFRRPVSQWKMQTAIGGGPVLLQCGEIKISNNEEAKFAGKAINDKHPRTAMGYTKDNRLIILVIEGRNPAAGGATLTQEAELLKDLGCVEALNLDGGGSSCMLVNGKETIKPSDKEGQRAVPAVFIIK